MSRASSLADEEAVAVLKAPAKHVVDHHDEEERSQSVALEDPRSCVELVGGAVAGLYECLGAAVQIHDRRHQRRRDAIVGQHPGYRWSAQGIESLSEVHKDYGHATLSGSAAIDDGTECGDLFDGGSARTEAAL